MPNEPEDDLWVRQALVFSLILLTLTAVLYVVVCWLGPMRHQRSRGTTWGVSRVKRPELRRAAVGGDAAPS